MRYDAQPSVDVLILRASFESASLLRTVLCPFSEFLLHEHRCQQTTFDEIRAISKVQSHAFTF